jgi:hypothetical protein
MLGDRNPSGSDMHWETVPFHGVDDAIARLRRLFPSEQLRDRIRIICVCGHGDFGEPRALQYSRADGQLILIQHTLVCAALLQEAPRAGIMLSTCGAGHDMSIYKFLNARNGQWIGAFPDMGTDRKLGVTWDESASQEFDFYRATVENEGKPPPRYTATSTPIRVLRF